jgi:hypothetical protein
MNENDPGDRNSSSRYRRDHRPRRNHPDRVRACRRSTRPVHPPTEKDGDTPNDHDRNAGAAARQLTILVENWMVNATIVGASISLSAFRQLQL